MECESGNRYQDRNRSEIASKSLVFVVCNVSKEYNGGFGVMNPVSR